MSCFLKINLFFLFLFLGSECCNWAEPHQVIFGAQIIKARYYQIKDAGMESLLTTTLLIWQTGSGAAA